MIKKLSKYIQRNQLINKEDRLLVAASAGVDSTVLCYLLNELNIKFTIAHCNFNLRGKDSDEDELFVKELAEGLNVLFYSTSFKTEEYAANKKLSIQEAARELRYNWLQNIAREHNFSKIATAHHLDDNIETVLLNFAKGTGIKGMRGILPNYSMIIRPLLYATKKEILAYAKQEGITFREDSSNLTDKYTRNKIRQKIIPVFEEINPSFQNSAGETISHLKEIEQIYNYAIGQLRNELMELEKPVLGNNHVWKINVQKLLRSPAPQTVLFELLRTYGFNNTNTRQILQGLGNEPGSYFYSGSHRLLIDREFLIIETKSDLEEIYFIENNYKNSTYKIPGGKLIFQNMEDRLTAFPESKNIALFDADKISWPIAVRHWTPGDFFHPLGMQGRKKKLQDFFTNLKLSRSEKEKVWIMESQGDICWVVGHRIDERFKVTAETVRCLVVEFLPVNFAKG